MKRNIKKTIKKAVVAVAAASMLTVLTAPHSISGASSAKNPAITIKQFQAVHCFACAAFLFAAP